MNKLFSTLCAGLVLATVGASSASAIKLKADGAYNEKLYQISVGTTGDSVVYMTNRADGNDSLYIKSLTTLDPNEFANTLWCVAVSKPASQGQSYTFDFLNKSTGKKLAIDTNSLLPGANVNADANTGLPVGTEVDGWAFSMAAGDQEIETGMPLYSYIPGSADSLAVLAYESLDVTSSPTAVDNLAPGHMTALTFGANAAAKPKMISDGYIFTIQAPKRLSLNAKALHTILGSKDSAAINLDFYKTFPGDKKETKVDPTKILNNIFAQDLVARDSVNNNGDLVGVFLMKADKKSYIRVDTAYQNASGTGFLTLTDTTSVPYFEASQTAKKDGKYLFHFSYAPENDSLFIKVDSATYKTVGGTAFDHTTANPDSTYIILQDLEANKTWALTAGWDTIRTRIGLGFGTCGEAAVSNRVSVANNGLYTIKDKATGKYFAYPLYGNGEKAMWVEFDETSQLAAHMPAYQWIIQKSYTTGDLAATSRFTIVNREYVGNPISIQLYKDKDGKIYAKSSGFEGTDLEVTEIDKTVYPEAYNDPYLGYKYMDKAVIDYNVNKYKFKYFHPYALDDNARYLAVGEKTDSLLYAKTKDAAVASAFELRSSGVAREYGVKVVKDNAYDKIGIVQLKRAAYSIAQGEAVMDSIVNKKYAMAKGVAAADVDSFYFKENNHYGKDDFYAILKVVVVKDANNNDVVVPMYSKAGVSDDNTNSPIGVQELATERTSAFAISLDDTPLYRRFNNANINEVETGLDSLLFRELYRNEYLMDETNKNFLNGEVNYLGIWSKDKAKGKLAFKVDSAWIVRGIGNGIKPQYLISVSRDDFEGKAAEPCGETTGHITADGKPTNDPLKCKHAHPAIPAFDRGMYLVSFADSVAKYGKGDEKALPYLDADKAYTRVGFVEAIRKGDSLYVLPAAYKKVANEAIDFAVLDKENEALVKANKIPFITALNNDDHKNVTWSFRYVHPEKAANVEKEGIENSFLIESMNYDGKEIAPDTAAWLKNQNGCLVLTNDKSTFENAVTGGDPALRFNVDRKTADDQYATDNEVITASGIVVVGEVASVRVANAEGKNVVITNVLGQKVGEAKITSNNATISVNTTGVVVVSVEGEAAVKTIVK